MASMASRFTHEPEDRLALALEAVDAFEALSAGGSTDDRALQSIVKAASIATQARLRDWL
jgi:hypothetical protein